MKIFEIVIVTATAWVLGIGMFSAASACIEIAEKCGVGLGLAFGVMWLTIVLSLYAKLIDWIIKDES